MPELAVNSPPDDYEPDGEPTQDEIIAGMGQELHGAYQHIDELHARVAAAEEVCEAVSTARFGRSVGMTLGRATEAITTAHAKWQSLRGGAK